MAREDIDAALSGISDDQLWLRPNDVASLGFHLAHLAGSTDRLMTYARGEPLSDAQRSALVREQRIGEVRPSLEALLEDLASDGDGGAASSSLPRRKPPYRSPGSWAARSCRPQYWACCFIPPNMRRGTPGRL